jgi:geranylgeranylglycerol-phosphate geranylgeranyltransferase
VNRIVQLFRIGNCLMGIVGLLMSVLIATGTSIGNYWADIVPAAFVVFFFVAAGNSLNDYMDREVDKVAHPERPIPSGKLKPNTARTVAIYCFAAALVFSFFLRLEATLVVIVAMALMLTYELSTKKKGFSGNLTIGLLTGMLFVFGGSVVGLVDKTIIIALMAGLATLGREIVKDIQDMEGDFDRTTLPKRIGKRNAGIVGSVAFVTAVALSPVPYLTSIFGQGYLMVVVVADAIFIYCSIVHFRNPTRGQRLAKYGMLVALVAFLLGGIQ